MENVLKINEIATDFAIGHYHKRTLEDKGTAERKNTSVCGARRIRY